MTNPQSLPGSRALPTPSLKLVSYADASEEKTDAESPSGTRVKDPAPTPAGWRGSAEDPVPGPGGPTPGCEAGPAPEGNPSTRRRPTRRGKERGARTAGAGKTRAGQGREGCVGRLKAGSSWPPPWCPAERSFLGTNPVRISPAQSAHPSPGSFWVPVTPASRQPLPAWEAPPPGLFT